MPKIICPSCGGGRTKEKSYQVFPDGRGRCFRASCGYYGKADPSDVPSPSTWNGPRSHGEALSEEHRRWLVGRIGEKATRRLGAFSEGSRIGLPVYSPEGIEVGWMLRGSSPKYLSVLDPAYKLGSWYGLPGSSVLLVEDQLSSCYYNSSTEKTAVALLGCTISKDLALYLASKRIKARIALDRDALHKDVRAYLQYRSILDIEIVPIRDDVKNLSVQEIREL